MIRLGWMAMSLLMVMGAGTGATLHRVLTPELADAEVDRVFPAHFCIPTVNEQGSVNDRFTLEALYSPKGVIDVGVDVFYCPIIRYLAFGTLDDVWVRHINAPGDNSCCVHSVSLGGRFHELECLRGAQNASAIQHFTLNDFTEFDGGHYLVTCSMLEQFSGLHSIRSNEN